MDQGHYGQLIRGITSDVAVRRYPELAHLLTLTQSSWRFVLGTDDDEELVALVGFRNADQYTDALYVYDRSDTLAARLLADQPGTLGGIVWRYYGSLADAVPELLALPEPGHRLAPSLIVASGPLSPVDWKCW